MVGEVKQVDILAVGVHPDDVELSCSGTLLKHKSLGYTFGILDLTLGELGTRGSAELRTKEAIAAAQMMGAEFRVQLDLGDGFFQNNEDSLRQIIPIIRASKAKILLANSIEDRHPDHGRAANLVYDAAFLAGLHRIESSWNNIQQPAHRPSTIYHYTQDYFLNPDLVVDITGFEEEKIKAILCFASQFYDPNSKEPESAISNKSFMEQVKAKDRVAGRSIGVEFGESFKVRRSVGVSDLFTLK